jgi:replicative superfamily II helicase
VNEKLDPILRYSIAYGIVYHNSSLATEERQLIEDSFKQRTVNVVFATSTLAAGVNMPAQRVLLIGLRMGIEKHSVKQYKQMIGRAGRAGLDDIGESFLLVEEREKKEALKLMYIIVHIIK